jgi:hypothetical protein
MADDPNPAVDAPAPPANETSSCDLRLQRLVDYMADALTKRNPLEANLGAVNGDLLLLEYRFRQGLDDLLNEAPNSLEELQAAMPGVEGLLRIVKQIDRFSQLASKLAATAEHE